MKITKVVKTTYTVNWVSFDHYFVWGEFKEIREKKKLATSPWAICFNCSHSFSMEEPFYLASIEKLGNRSFCKACVDKFNISYRKQHEKDMCNLLKSDKI